ncbi:hypothetical protein Hanom_Chr10g00913991 [Helianthus anomalus]
MEIESRNYWSQNLIPPHNSINKYQVKIKSKLQVLSFMFKSNCRRYPFGQKFTGGVLNLSKSCTFCPLG